MTFLSRKPRAQPPDPTCWVCEQPMSRKDKLCGCVEWFCPCGDERDLRCEDHLRGLDDDWPPSDVA